MSDAVSPLGLCLVERLIGRAQQGIRPGHARGGGGDADADCEFERDVVHKQRMSSDAFANALGYDRGLCRLGFREQNRELFSIDG